MIQFSIKFVPKDTNEKYSMGEADDKPLIERMMTLLIHIYTHQQASVS